MFFRGSDWREHLGRGPLIIFPCLGFVLFVASWVYIWVCIKRIKDGRYTPGAPLLIGKNVLVVIMMAGLSVMSLDYALSLLVGPSVGMTVFRLIGYTIFVLAVMLAYCVAASPGHDIGSEFYLVLMGAVVTLCVGLFCIIGTTPSAPIHIFYYMVCVWALPIVVSGRRAAPYRSVFPVFIVLYALATSLYLYAYSGRVGPIVEYLSLVILFLGVIFMWKMFNNTVTKDTTSTQKETRQSRTTTALDTFYYLPSYNQPIDVYVTPGGLFV